MSGHGNLRTWPEAETIHRAPLAVKLDAGMAMLFRYGVAVLLSASPDAERALRERLSARTENPFESVDEFEVHEHQAFTASEAAAQLHCAPERSISPHSSFLNDRIERVVQLLEEFVMAAKKKGKKKKK